MSNFLDQICNVLYISSIESIWPEDVFRAILFPIQNLASNYGENEQESGAEQHERGIPRRSINAINSTTTRLRKRVIKFEIVTIT